ARRAGAPLARLATDLSRCFLRTFFLVMADHARLSAVVRGRVQGVGFRHFTRQQALALGVVGWVRNEHDGSVALEAEGPRTDLESLLQAVRRGPSAARVS